VNPVLAGDIERLRAFAQKSLDEKIAVAVGTARQDERDKAKHTEDAMVGCVDQYKRELAASERTAKGLVEALEMARPALRYPPQGDLVCRWCHRNLRDGHETGCRYVTLTRQVDETRNAVETALDAYAAQSEPARAVAAPGGPAGRPKIICLCGSTRFIEQFAIQTWELERQGNIVLGCTLLPMWYCECTDHFGEKTGTKVQCDELHLRKIDLADEVLVLNVGGYVGESTRNEIVYAAERGKSVRYLEAPSVQATAKGGE
jgi:hypothetical protein